MQVARHATGRRIDSHPKARSFLFPQYMATTTLRVIVSAAIFSGLGSRSKHSVQGIGQRDSYGHAEADYSDGESCHSFRAL
jgi:hypothetical protein